MYDGIHNDNTSSNETFMATIIAKYSETVGHLT